jgi:hypothetical protein
MRMRVLIAVALLIAGIAGITAARAADIPSEHARSAYNDILVVGQRAGALYIYDYEPGVVIRAYWLPPWRNRHYFPASGRRPRVGRLEHISARGVPMRAESYYRSWSTAPAFYPGLSQEDVYPELLREERHPRRVTPPRPEAPVYE